MSTRWYGHRFVLQHGPVPRSNGGMRITIEFDTGEEPDHWGLAEYEPLLELLQDCRRGAADVAFAIQTFKPKRYTDEMIQPPMASPLPEERGPLIDLGAFEIEQEFHGDPCRD